MNTVYKIALVGDTCVGKTALMEKITNGDFILHYEPNNDAVTILDVATNQEPITFSIWEFNTNSSLETLQYFDAAIIMTSANDKKSFENIPYWIRVIEKNNSKIPNTVLISQILKFKFHILLIRNMRVFLFQLKTVITFEALLFI